MSKGNTFENDLLKLIFNAIPIPSIADNAEVGDGEHPLVLAANEGFVIRSVAVPATGTWQACINVDWTEVDTY